MMKKLIKLAVVMGCLLFIVSCSHYDDLMKNGNESTASGESHNAGQNCMKCHNEGEFTEAVLEGGWWHIAGTVYGSKANTVELWTGLNRTGELVYKLPVDPLGNFYTAKIVNFKGGFYPVVVKDDGSILAMQEKTTIGACNSCHGITTPTIVVN